jgi:hypothetical protein
MADNQNKNKTREAAANVGQAATAAADKARDAASSLASKASEAASNVGQKAQEWAGTAAERAGDALATAGQGMSSLAGTLHHNAPQEGMLGSAAGSVANALEAGGRYLQEHDLQDMGEDLRGFVRQYPLGSLLCVFGVGLLMGRALGR